MSADDVATQDFLSTCCKVLITVAGQFTCDEAEAVYHLYVDFDRQQQADWFMQAHAQGDNDPADRHEFVPELSPIGWRRR